MDCIQAQSIVSEAMDRQPIAAALLAEAKEHCRTCPECVVFVRAQLAAKNAVLPTPPADLADRVMAQVRIEAAEKAAAIAAAEEQERAAQAAAQAAAAAPTPPPVSLAPRPVRKRQLPRVWVSAAAAAAVVVALLGTGAVVIFGMKTMSGVTSTEAPSATQRSGGEASYGAAETSEGAMGSDGTAAAPAKALGPQFITVNGTVYSWSGVDDTSVTTLTKLGTTTTSLGGKGQTVARTVYVGRSPDTVYVVDDEDVVHAFVRLTRDYRGQTYILVSSELTGYGQWPTLPTGISAPTSPDGLPTFVPGALDSSNVQTYKPAVATGVNGIAIAPSTDTGPMENNPNWTWWIPSR